jgi:hypothetical protein
MVTFSACNKRNQTDIGIFPIEDQLMQFGEIIQAIDNNRILVGDTYYTIDKKTVLENRQYKKISFSDLQPGSIIKLQPSKNVATSYPGQGYAIRVSLFDDKRSQQISTAIQYILNNHNKGNIIEPKLYSIRDDELIIRFKEFDIDGKNYEAIFNLKTKKLDIKELIMSKK